MNMMLRRRAMMSSGPKEQPNYLCFTALESGTFTFTIGANVTISDIDYVEFSVNDGATWVKTKNIANSIVTITTPTIAGGNKVLWRGNGTRISVNDNNGSFSSFSSTCLFEVSGNPMSLLFNNFNKVKSNTTKYLLADLFRECQTIMSAYDMELTLETIGSYCYSYMFYRCYNIEYVPKKCNCINANAYSFNGYNWVTNANPKLKNITDISLIKSVGSYTFSRMYQNNKNIESSVCLNFQSTGSNSLFYMFYGCSKINYIHCMLLGNITNLSGAFQSVASTGVFVKHIDAAWEVTGNNGVPTNWTIIYYDPTTDKYYLSDKTTECDDHGNPI